MPAPTPMLLRRALLAVTLLLVPASAAAQVSDADRATARALATEGAKALRENDFAGAADRFGRAFALVRAPTVALGLARAQVGLGKWVAAYETYNGIVRAGAEAGAPPPFVRAVADAQRELDALTPRLPGVVIALEGPGAGAAKVTLDGASVPAAVLGVKRPVDPGRHTIRVESAGFLPVEAVVTAAEGKSETVTLAVDRADVKAPDAGPAPTPPAPAGGVQKALGFTAIGVGGAALVMGAVTGGLAVVKHGSLASTCPEGKCTGQQSAVDSFYLMANLSTAGIVAGSALAVTGVVLVLTAPRATKSAVKPVLGVGYVGAIGTF